MSSHDAADADADAAPAIPDAAQPTPTQKKAPVHFEKERGVSEVVVLPGVHHVTVRLSGSGGMVHRVERLRLLEHLADRNVPVFLVKMPPGCLSFAMRSETAERGLFALREIKADFASDAGLALVSTHAGAMRDLSGVMADIYDALAGAGVRIKQTGDAYNAVLCLVPGEKAEAAQNALCGRFTLPEPEPLFAPLDSGPVPRPAL